MTDSSPTERPGLKRKLARAGFMAANVPPGQLLRRLHLRARFRLLSRLPPPDREALPAAPVPPRSPLVDGDQPPSSAPAAWPVMALPWGERALPRSLLDGPAAWRTPPAPEGFDPALARAELNNLHFMDYLAGASDEAFAALVAAWIRHNPPGAKGAARYAWRPYNLSLRAVTWMRGLDARGERLDPAFRAEARRSLARQLRFLARHLETDLRGNHLIKNVLALAWGAAFFEGPEADGWRGLALRHLRREIPEQALGDGCHAERSPAYQCQVLGDFIDLDACARASAASGRPWPGSDASALRAAIERLLAGLSNLTHPDGLVAAFNDGGLSMAPKPAGLAAAWSALSGEASLALESGAFAMREGGYFGFSAPGELLVADCGPLGPRYLIGHGHGDVGSIEWSTGGLRFLVDPGTHQYVPGTRREASRATSSHNTVWLEDAAGRPVDQSDLYGSFRCGRRAAPELRRFGARGVRLPDGRERPGVAFEISHDGYDVHPGRPRPVRSVEACAGFVRVADTLDGALPPGWGAALGFLIHPEVEAERLDDAGRSWRLRRGGVTVRATCSEPLAASPAERYPDLYVVQDTLRLITRLTAGRAWRLETVFEREDGA